MTNAPMLDVLVFPPGEMSHGEARSVTWEEFCTAFAVPLALSDLSDPNEAKKVAGGYSPAKYRANVRQKGNLVHVSALVVDVDEGGDVDRVAEVLSRYRCIVHDTYRSTAASPRCRAILPLAEPVDASTYERAHAVVRAHLRACGVVADEGAKDVSRLSYFPVRPTGASYRVRILDGDLFDAFACVARQPKPEPRAAPKLITAENRSAYARGALRRAVDAVTNARPGDRHRVLCREAYSLARSELGLSSGEIEQALLPAFVQAAGEARRDEGRATIRDAVRAQRK